MPNETGTIFFWYIDLGQVCNSNFDILTFLQKKKNRRETYSVTLLLFNMTQSWWRLGMLHSRLSVILENHGALTSRSILRLGKSFFYDIFGDLRTSKFLAAILIDQIFITKKLIKNFQSRKHIQVYDYKIWSNTHYTKTHRNHQTNSLSNQKKKKKKNPLI